MVRHTRGLEKQFNHVSLDVTKRRDGLDCDTLFVSAQALHGDQIISVLAGFAAPSGDTSVERFHFVAAIPRREVNWTYGRFERVRNVPRGSVIPQYRP